MVDPIRVSALNQVGRASVINKDISNVFYNYTADFSAAASIVFDFKTINQGNIFGVPKSVFVDNGTNPSKVEVLVTLTNQTFTVPAFAQGVFTLNANLSSDIKFVTGGGATDKCNITLYNYEVPPQVWYSFGTFNFDKPLATYGAMKEGDTVATDPNNNPVYIGGINRATGLFEGVSVDATGRVNVNAKVDDSIPVSVSVSNFPALRGAYTDRSIPNLTGASQVLMAANANRRVLVISNVAANPMAVNLTGGAAVIGAAGSLTLAPNAFLSIDQYPPTSAITIIGTLNDDVTAYEG